MQQIKTLLKIFGVCFIFSCCAEKKELRKPNILFVFADDQRSGTINALGNQHVITPNIDRLVNNGVSYTNTYIMGGTSAAVCSPSRAMLMTGRHLFGIKTQGWEYPILENTESMIETFRKAGYVTFGTGKHHNGRDVFARGFTAGDQIFFGGMSDHWNVPVYHFDKTGKYKERIPVVKNPGSNNTISYLNCSHIVNGKHSSELFADATIEFLKHHDPKKSFFAYLPFTAPHDPRSMPKEYEEMYDANTLPVPKNFLPQHPFNFGDFKIRDELLAPFPRTESIVKEHIREYYAMITHMDAQIGRVIEQLKKSGMYENTIIVFSADNGLAVGQHGMMGKQNLYEHSIGVPFIISGPGIPKNEKREALCYLYDVFPTLCDLTGVHAPKTVQGKSFYATINDANKTHREQMYFAYKQYIRAYRKGNLKLIEYFVKGKRHTQLFDIVKDPFEINDLSTNKALTSHCKNLKQALISKMKKANDTTKIYKQLLIE